MPQRIITNGGLPDNIKEMLVAEGVDPDKVQGVEVTGNEVTVTLFPVRFDFTPHRDRFRAREPGE
jgi:hypothetical protein